MGLGQRENEEMEQGQELDALVQKKVLLLGRVISLTEEMKDYLLRNEAEKLGTLLARRQTCMEKVDQTDLLLSKAAKAQPGKDVMEQEHARIRSILLQIESLDQELADRVKKETDTLKEELLKMRTVRRATDRYREKAGQTSRFLDLRNQ